jgi:hypothetical protein
LEEFDVFRASPDVDSSLLGNREDNEAYLAYIPGEQYALFFPGGGTVSLDMTDIKGPLTLRWLDISKSSWSEKTELEGGKKIDIQTPGNGQWIALIAM